MKILLIGIFIFFGWSSFSTYFYVCRIRGLCNEPVPGQFSSDNKNEDVPADTLSNPMDQEQAAMPENLTIYFAFDNSEFKSDAETNRYFAESETYLGQNSEAVLRITGHTDAIGSDEYNLALGHRRAQTVQHYFERKGLSTNRIIIESKGEKAPVEDNNSTRGRANNRRAEITIKK
jgi:outer membrane protein OmpA-like peptidoglycan-associated protein